MTTSVVYTRQWAMPNAETFKIAPIRALVGRTLDDNPGVWVDPFVRDSVFKHRMTHTNDLNPAFDATHHLDARVFLAQLPSDSADGILLDPPYSSRQISECYEGVGLSASITDTQSTFYTEIKEQTARVIRHGGVVVSCGWNSGGVGKTLGFCLESVLLVPHGGPHNDTIVTVEKKTYTRLGLFDAVGAS